MAQGDIPITVTGNLVADPELTFLPSGAAVSNFTIASTPRTYNREAGEWQDGEATFLRCSVWRQQAEHTSECLRRGMRVLAVGRLRSRQFETREGEKRTVIELDVDDIGPSLRYATAEVRKANRTQGGDGDGPRNTAGLPYDDPWAHADTRTTTRTPTAAAGGDEPGW